MVRTVLPGTHPVGEVCRTTMRFGSVAGLSLSARREAGQAVHGMPVASLPVGVPDNFWSWSGVVEDQGPKVTGDADMDRIRRFIHRPRRQVVAPVRRGLPSTVNRSFESLAGP
ncbi:MAG: hypothetical protein ACRD0U_16365, partial [Acidimicrobiales bacterium]